MEDTLLSFELSLSREISRNAGRPGHPVADDAVGFDRENARVRSYYSGFRPVRPRYGELCMVSPAASRRAGSFPCVLCICRVIDGHVNFHRGPVSIPSPGLSSSTRRLRYACRCDWIIFFGAINLPPITAGCTRPNPQPDQASTNV